MVKVKFLDTRNNISIEKEFHSITPYMFTDGNYSCDCNRSKLMYDCKYEDMRKCNLNNNTILVKIYDNNELCYNEMEKQEEEWDKFLVDMGMSAFSNK